MNKNHFPRATSGGVSIPHTPSTTNPFERGVGYGNPTARSSCLDFFSPWLNFQKSVKNQPTQHQTLAQHSEEYQNHLAATTYKQGKKE